MSISDPHDPRTFRQFAKLNADGSIAATVLVADGAPDPVDGANSVYADVTAHYGTSLDGVSIDPAFVASLTATAQALDVHRANVATAETELAAAKASLALALSQSIAATAVEAIAVPVASPLPVVLK